MRLLFRNKHFLQAPIVASATLMVLGAFNSDCGVRESALVDVPTQFNEVWRSRVILLEEGQATHCLTLAWPGCSLAQKLASGEFNTQSYSSCTVVQELLNAGDSVILLCDDCGENGSATELFRVNSDKELTGQEVEIIDRDDNEKKFVVLDYQWKTSCSGYLGIESPAFE